VLNWSAVPTATFYNVYRNGTLIGPTASTSFTDTTATEGTYSYYVTSVNAAGGESAPGNTVTVMVGTQPSITSAASASTPMDQPFSFTVTTTGHPTPSLVESGPLPSGLSFTDNGDGTATIAGMAAAGTAGDYPITVTASNGLGTPATQSFDLTVTTATSAPAITSASSDTESFGVPFSFTVTTTGYPLPALTKSGALPAGVTFTDNGDGTATIAGTPAASALGVYSLTLKAKSSSGTTTQSFTLTITKSPVLHAVATKTAHAGTAFTLTVKSSGYYTPSLSESGALPSGLTFIDNGDGTATLAGTPAVGSGGEYSVTVTATNVYGSAAVTFTLKVDEAPVITSQSSASASVGEAFSFQVTATGFPDPQLSKVGKLPSGLTLSASTGTISGTPGNKAAGTYYITFIAKNSSGEVSQMFVLTVT
jgi:fibronectin type 3 domain-containing protein